MKYPHQIAVCYETADPNDPEGSDTVHRIQLPSGENVESPESHADTETLLTSAGVTHVASCYGMDSHEYGDLPDGLHPLDEWLQWIESLE